MKLREDAFFCFFPLSLPKKVLLGGHDVQTFVAQTEIAVKVNPFSLTLYLKEESHM